MPQHIRAQIGASRLKRKATLGYLNSPETRQKMSAARKGTIPWNKGKTGVQASTRRGIPLSQEIRTKISLTLTGTRLPEEQKHKISKALSGRTTWNKGIPHTEDHKRKIGDAHRGEKSHWWIQDRSKLAKHDKRGDFANVAWRQAVKLRDGKKCRIGDENCRGQLEVHHILRWSIFTALRYDINNGITLCHYHHPRRRADEDRLSPYFKSIIGGALQ